MLLRAELAERVRLDQRRVVDEDLGDADAIDDLVERGAQGGLVGDVGADADGLGAEAGQGRQRGVDRAGRAGEDADGKALAGEAPGDGGPDPGTRSDDDGSWHGAYEW